MSIIYVLIPLAIIIIVIAIAVFFWAVKNDQFADLERQGHSILFDDDSPRAPSPPGSAPRETPSSVSSEADTQRSSDE